MRIVQILPVLAFGDAVGNDTRALKDALLEAGYETEIYAAVIDERLPQGTAEPFDMLEKLEEDDIVIYHLSTGHKLNYEIEKLGGKKVILYHNITPEQYFKNITETQAPAVRRESRQQSVWLRLLTMRLQIRHITKRI